MEGLMQNPTPDPTSVPVTTTLPSTTTVLEAANPDSAATSSGGDSNTGAAVIWLVVVIMAVTLAVVLRRAFKKQGRRYTGAELALATDPSPEEVDDSRARLDRLCDMLVAAFVSSLDSKGRDTSDSSAGGMCFGIATEGDPDGCLMFLAQRHALALGANQGAAEAAESLVRSFGIDPASGHDFRSALDQFASIRDGVLELMITGDESETSQAIQAVLSRGEDNTVMVLRAAGLLLANLEAPR